VRRNNHPVRAIYILFQFREKSFRSSRSWTIFNQPRRVIRIWICICIVQAVGTAVLIFIWCQTISRARLVDNIINVNNYKRTRPNGRSRFTTFGVFFFCFHPFFILSHSSTIFLSDLPYYRVDVFSRLDSRVFLRGADNFFPRLPQKSFFALNTTTTHAGVAAEFRNGYALIIWKENIAGIRITSGMYM